MISIEGKEKRFDEEKRFEKEIDRKVKKQGLKLN